VTSQKVAAAKTLKYIKRIMAELQPKPAQEPSVRETRTYETSVRESCEKAPDELLQRAVAFLQSYYTADPRLFKSDKETATALNKHLKLKASDSRHFRPLKIAQLKRSAVLRDVRESLGLGATGRRRTRWTRADYLAAVRLLNKHDGSFRERLRRASTGAIWKTQLSGRTWTAVAGRLLLLHEAGQLRFDSTRREYYYDSSAEVTDQPNPHGTQFWNRQFLLESLATHAEDLGEDDPRGIAEAIEDETGVAVTAQQVIAALRSTRFRIFCMARRQ